MSRIAVFTTSFGKEDALPLERLKNAGYTAVLNPYKRRLKAGEIIESATGCVGIIAGTESYTDDVLKKLTKLRVISRVGIGLDNIDLKAATDLGIKVLNTPDAVTSAVAELTISLILTLIRQVPCHDREIRCGNWEKRMGFLLRGKNIGIIGFGRVGRKVVALLTPFDASIAFFDADPTVSDPVIPAKPFPELLQWADIITLHCPGKALLGRHELSLMKRGAWLVNTARGELVDEAALYDALANGHLAGAALDVFANEPYQGPLIKLEQVILTPHIGSYAKESRIAMEIEAVENLLKGLAS